MTVRVWAGFAGLCVLSGSGWLVEMFVPHVLSGLMRTAVHAVVIGVALLGNSHGGSWGEWRRIAGWSAVLLAVPGVLVVGAGGAVGSFTEVLIFTLVPVVVVLVMGSQGEFGLGEDGMAGLVPALIGMSGVALLLPLPGSVSVVGWIWIAGLVVSAVGCGAAGCRLHELLRGVGVLRAAGVGCVATALVVGVFVRGGLGSVSLAGVLGEVGGMVLVEVPVVLLTVWMLREMSPVGFSARYVVVPVVTVLEGILLLRPELNWVMAAGILLGVVGAWGLMRGSLVEG